MNLTENNNEAILSLDDIYFADAFTKQGEKLNLEVDNINIRCITSKNDNFSLDEEGNLLVNSITTNTGGGLGGSFDILSVYPVGSIYLSSSNVNPSTYFGGNWSLFGAGKCLVGVDMNDTDFNTSEKIGGVKTHTHTCPTHTHNIDSCVALVNTLSSTVEILGKSYNWKSGERANCSSYTGSGRSQNWATQTRGTTSATAVTTNSSSNLMPYITCYMWKRNS